MKNKEQTRPITFRAPMNMWAWLAAKAQEDKRSITQTIIFILECMRIEEKKNNE